MNLINKISAKKLIPIVLLVFVAFGFMYLFIVRDSSATKTSVVHISVRPTDATPITVYSTSGKLDTFLTPEFDINYASSMGELTFTSSTHELSEKFKPTAGSLTITLKPKTNISGQDKFLSAVSTDETYEISEELRISNFTEYANGRWVFGILTSDKQATDGERVVVEHTGEKNVIVIAGTDFDLQSLLDTGVPQDIAEQILKDSNEE